MAQPVRIKTWVTDDILTASDLNGEFNNIINNQEDLGYPRTGSADFDGQEIILDEDGDTSITADTANQIDIRVGGTDVIVITGSVFTYLGSSVVTRQTLQRLGVSGLLPKISNVEHRVSNIESNSILMNQVFS